MTEQEREAINEQLQQCRLLTMEEAAGLARISLQEVQRLVLSEEWESVKIGRLRRIRAAWLARHLEKRARGGAASQSDNDC